MPKDPFADSQPDNRADADPHAGHRPPRRRSLILRLLFWGGAGVLAAVAFVVIAHAPLTRWLLNNQAPWLLKRFGVDVNWHVSGNVRDQIRFEDVTVTTEKTPLVFLAADKMFASYEIMRLFRGEALQVPRLIRLNDVNAVVDLTRIANAPKQEEKKKRERKPFDPKQLDTPPPDLRVNNLSLDLITRAGVWRARSFFLDLAPSGAGTLRGLVESPQRPGEPYHVDGEFTWRKRALEITMLRADDLIIAKKLRIAMPEGPEKAMNFALEISRGAAVLAGSGVIDPAKGSDTGPVLSADLTLSRLTVSELAPFLPQPPPVQGGVKFAAIRVDGPVNQPKALVANMRLETTPLTGEGWNVDGASLQFSGKNGDWTIEPFAAWIGANRVEVTVAAAAPATWAEVADTAGKARIFATIPDLEKAPHVPPGLAGALRLTGEADFGEKTVRAFQATLAGNEVRKGDLIFDALQLNAAGDLKAVRFDLTALSQLAGLDLSAKGDLGLTDAKPLNVEWSAVVPRPQDAAVMFTSAWPADLQAGLVESSGRVSASLNDLTKQNFDAAEVELGVTAKDIVWRGAPSPEARVRARLKDGQAVVEEIAADFAGENKLRLTASAALSPLLAHFAAPPEAPVTASTPPAQADLDLQVDFPSLPALAPWFKAAQAPEPTSGSLSVAWKGGAEFVAGQTIPLVSATGSLKLTPTRLTGIADPVSADLLIEHNLQSAKLPRIQAAFGPWTLDGSLAADPGRVTLFETKIAHDKRDIIRAEADLPLALGGTQKIPVNPSEPLTLKITTEKPVTVEEIQRITGKELPVRGAFEVQADLKGPIGALDGFLVLKGSGIREVKQEYLEAPASLDFRADFAGGKVTAKNVVDAKPLEPLTVTVNTAVDPLMWASNPDSFWNTPVKAVADLKPTALDVAEKRVPAYRNIDGTLSAHIEAEGTFRTPKLKGAIEVKNGELEPKDPATPHVKDLQVRITGEDTNLKIEALRAYVSGGSVTASGEIGLADAKNPTFNLRAAARDALVMRDDTMLVRTDADVTVTGALEQATVAGRIAIVNSRVFKEIEYAPLARANDLPPVPPSPPGPAADPNAPMLPPPLDKWVFNLTVVTREPVRLMGNLVNGSAEADLKVGGSGAKPAITGRLTFDKTRLRFPFSTLTVDHGAVVFSPEAPLDPSLELKASSHVNGYDVTLRGYGPAKSPKIVFSSSPPLGEGDIATLLATGQTSSALSQGGEGLEGQAAFFLLSQAYRKMFKKNLYDEGKPPKFSVSHTTVGGGLGGVVGTYKTSENTRLESTIRADGGFRSVFRYLFRFH